MFKRNLLIIVVFVPFISLSQRIHDKKISKSDGISLTVPDSFKFDLDKAEKMDFTFSEALAELSKKNESNMPIFKPMKIPHIIVLDIDSAQVGFMMVYPPWRD